MENDLIVESWSDLQEKLFQNTWDENLNRFRSNFVYRGMEDSRHKLETSLMRIKGPYDLLERHLLRNFRKYAYKNEIVGNSIWNWLAMAQHHGLPTRMLDWTYSPYIALHFTTASMRNFDRDGVIWAVDYSRINNYLPDELITVIREEGSNTFTVEMLDSVCTSLSEFDGLQKENFALFFEPPALDERIINQHALFSLMSSPKGMLDKWLSQHSELYFRIIIPKELKWEIRDKLDQANITERVLFPGLDGLSKWLKRHYSQRS